MTEEVSDPPLTDDRQVAAEAPPPVPATTRPGRLRRLLHVTLPGCWGAVVFACLSLTPSLLPRGGFIQGLVSGITAAIGYGLGVLVAWLWRAYADRDARVPKPSSCRPSSRCSSSRCSSPSAGASGAPTTGSQTSSPATSAGGQPRRPAGCW